MQVESTFLTCGCIGRSKPAVQYSRTSSTARAAMTAKPRVQDKIKEEGLFVKYKMAKGGEAVGPCVEDIWWNLLSLAIAAAIWNLGYPILRAGTSDLTWVAWVFARNLGLMAPIFQGFHYMMYLSPSKDSFTKFNEKAPKPYEITRDRRYTLMSLFINSALECLMIRAWATGEVPYASSVLESPGKLALMLLASPFFRELHFVIYHRILHIQPLYKWFHKHHHLSYNPSPWSGLSMHPVESITYFTGPIIPCLLTKSHPLVYIFANVHAQIASVYGHHGHEEYGGSYFHYIHHAKTGKGAAARSCNYGTPFLPLDILMGTWDCGEKES